MAYTPAPENQTYGTHRVPLASDFKLRPGNNMNYPIATAWGQDTGMINALPVKLKGKEELGSVTRPGLRGVTINTTGVVRGMYVWERSSVNIHYFIVVGTGVWTSNADPIIGGGTWTQVDTLLTNATTPVRFTEFIDDTSTKKLILVDGVEGYVYTSNLPGTKITDVDFPTPHIPFPVFLNGRLYLAKSLTGDIYNSNLNDPAAWTAGDYISTEVYPDDIQALVKVENTILAIGFEGSEYFSDVGNATGTPLARQEGTALPFGTRFPNSIAYTKDTVVLLASTNEGQSSFKAIVGYQYKDIEATEVMTALTGRLEHPYNDYATAPSSCRGYFFKHGGLLYYVFHTDGVRGGAYQVPSVALCMVYSFDAKAWTEFQHGNDTTSRENRYSFPAFMSGPNVSASAVTYVAGNIGASHQPFFAKMVDSTAKDIIVGYNSGNAINVYEEWRTDNLTFDTMNRKAGHRLGLDVEIGDSIGADVTFNVQWNDYDYHYLYWTTARTVTINNPSGGTYFPFITQLGTFRRRAFRVYSNSGYVIRTRGMELDINKGQQ